MGCCSDPKVIDSTATDIYLCELLNKNYSRKLLVLSILILQANKKNLKLVNILCSSITKVSKILH